jgi:hypothetical protein
VTDPFFDHDKRDVYRLEVEYVAGTFAITRQSLESGVRRKTNLRPPTAHSLSPYSLLASCVANFSMSTP